MRRGERRTGWSTAVFSGFSVVMYPGGEGGGVSCGSRTGAAALKLLPLTNRGSGHASDAVESQMLFKASAIAATQAPRAQVRL